MSGIRDVLLATLHDGQKFVFQSKTAAVTAIFSSGQIWLVLNHQEMLELQPNHLRDEEITALEESLKNLNCQEINSVNSCSSFNSSPPSLNSSHSSLESSPPLEIPKLSLQDTFIFQNQQFANRRITPDDHQKFAKLVSKKWKQVGRSLCLQTGCRALRDHVIDNLAIEYEREGLYEQAYQLLRKFIDSEGKRATLQMLITALEDNALISVAEELLGLHQSDNLS